MRAPARTPGGALAQAGVLLLVLLLGVLLGAVGALWSGAGSSTAWAASILPFPLTLFLGHLGWFGVGLASALLRLVTRGRWPRRVQAEGSSGVPGAWAFPVVGLSLGLPGGLVAGAVPGGPGPFACMAVLAIAGAGYGQFLRYLARLDLLPFLEPE
jgi:hypothetical protein